MELEEIGEKEKRILLKAFDYDINKKEAIVDSLTKEELISADTKKVITLKNATLAPGSLEILDTTPLTISKLLRKKFESEENGS